MDNYDAVYAVLKSAIWGTDRYPFTPKGDEDWDAVYKELAAQAVAPLAADVLGASGVCSAQLRQKILMGTTKRIGFFNRLMKDQQELKNMLDAAQIPFVVLKGAAAAAYYPQPELRTMGDVDFIVLPKDFDRAAQLMLDHGYDPVDIENDRHYEYRKNGILFELHRYFSLNSNEEAGKSFDRMIFDAIPVAEQKRTAGYSFSMLPVMANGLVLLAHIDQHMESGLGLRQIIDWMLFVDRQLSEEKWEKEFEPAVRSYGMHKLAVTVTRMCQLYLGLREEGMSWCSAADEQLCHDLMAVIMKRGNFGRKIGDSVRTIQAVNEMASLSNLPKQLQQRGEANWKLLKKYPFLRPFAWLYQLFRYIFKGLSRPNAIRQFSKDLTERKEEAAVLDSLEITHRAGSERAVARRAGKEPKSRQK